MDAEAKRETWENASDQETDFSLSFFTKEMKTFESWRPIKMNESLKLLSYIWTYDVPIFWIHVQFKAIDRNTARTLISH